VPPLDKKYKHDIDVVVDRIVVRPMISPRAWPTAFETALRLADGLAIAEFADKPLPEAETSAGGSANKSLNETHERMLFSEKFACPVSGFTISTKSSRGCFRSTTRMAPARPAMVWAPELKLRAALMVPDRRCRCARAPWYPGPRPATPRPITPRRWKRWCKHFGFKPSPTPWDDLPKRCSNAILFGTRMKITFVYDDGLRSYKTSKTFEGVIRQYRAALEGNRQRLGARGNRVPVDHALPVLAATGSNRGPGGQDGGLHIGEVTELSIRNAANDWFDALPGQLNDQAEWRLPRASSRKSATG
jgi:excinuclease ABC subunit A